jgi:hypothetical protein
MPTCFKFPAIGPGFLVFVCLLVFYTDPIHADEGILQFYIRYDIKSSGNTITDTNLVMVPAQNDFRAVNFSQLLFSGVISATPGESDKSMEKRMKDNCLKSLLKNSGLKSIKARDHETVLSYEGAVIAPLNILKQSYNENQNQYIYEMQVEFSPMAFPDQWETLNVRHRVRKLFDEFFQFFK